jgi:hypothetical protein
MKPGERITNKYGTFEAVEDKNCEICVADTNKELCNELPMCSVYYNDGISLIFKQVEVCTKNQVTPCSDPSKCEDCQTGNDFEMHGKFDVE